MIKMEMPLGLGFALAQNPEAMKKFAAMPAGEQAGMVQRARHVSSKEEMQRLVDELSRPEG